MHHFLSILSGSSRASLGGGMAIAQAIDGESGAGGGKCVPPGPPGWDPGASVLVCAWSSQGAEEGAC